MTLIYDEILQPIKSSFAAVLRYIGYTAMVDKTLFEYNYKNIKLPDISLRENLKYQVFYFLSVSFSGQA